MKLRMKLEHILALLITSGLLISFGAALKITASYIGLASINTAGTYMIAIGVGEFVGIPIIAFAMFYINTTDKLFVKFTARNNQQNKDVS